jgi:hypothetical protein
MIGPAGAAEELATHISKENGQSSERPWKRNLFVGNSAKRIYKKIRRLFW